MNWLGAAEDFKHPEWVSDESVIQYEIRKATCNRSILQKGA